MSGFVARADQAQVHPVARVVEFALTTTTGRVVTVVVVLGLACVFCAQVRIALGPLWRLGTGGLVARRPGRWDATWLHAAPERPENLPTARGEGYPWTRWGRLPGYKRMVIRWALGGYLVALVRMPVPTMILTAAGVLVAVVVRLARAVTDWALRVAAGTFIPAAAAVLGYAAHDAAAWIAIPRVRLTWVPIAVDPRILRAVRWWPRLEHQIGALAVPVLRVPLEDDDARVLVRLDAETSSAAVGEVKRLGVARLPEGPWKAMHHEAQLMVEFRHPKRPPAEVWYDEDAFNAYPVDEVPIGQEAGGAWARLPLKKLTPHTVVSATTGWCKTTTANVYIAHTAGHGGQVFVNDPKRVGFVAAFAGLSNVVIRTTSDGWAHTVNTVLAEMERRYVLIERFPEIKEAPERYFQPWFLIIDERGSYVSDLKDWWKGQGEKGMPLPLRQEKKILWQGRAAGIYMLDLCQQAGLEVFLDSDGRDQRMARIASGPQSRSSWVMLFPGIAKTRVPMRKGRALLGIGVDSVTEIQLAQTTDAQARAFAEGGAALAERENKSREKRLTELLASAVLDRDTPSGPGQTAASVPGHSPEAGTQDTAVDNEATAILTVISGDAEKTASESVQPTLSLIKENAEKTLGGVPDEESGGVPKRGSDQGLIVGVKAAAELLGITEDAFIAMRKRRPLPDEQRRGIQPAWLELTLREWRSQAPRAGA